MEIRRAELLTYAIHRLAGNSKAWVERIGFFETWDKHTEAFLRGQLAMICCTGEFHYFNSAIKPAVLLRAACSVRDQTAFFVCIEQIVSQFSSLWRDALPTLAHLLVVWPNMPYREMCRCFAARQMYTPRPLSPDVSPRDANLRVWEVFWGCFGGVLGSVPAVF